MLVFCFSFSELCYCDLFTFLFFCDCQTALKLYLKLVGAWIHVLDDLAIPWSRIACKFFPRFSFVMSASEKFILDALYISVA